MAPVPRPDLRAFVDSPYAAELQQGTPDRRFGPQLEAEYKAARLLDGTTLIRAACLLGALITSVRTIEQVILRSWDPDLVIQLGPVLAISIALAVIACSPLFARFYLPIAQVAVPARNTIAAIAVAGAAANGQLEILIVLPLMVLGPFFFLGLPFRAALISVALTVTSFLIAAFAWGLDPTVALRSGTLLLVATAACALAARRLESKSRVSFLENRFVAELAQHDPLTGTKNRRVLDAHLACLWEQAVASGRTMAVLLIDVDHFKAYNDRYGHQAGDLALRRVAQTLQGFVRRPLDLLARYGGEEFAAVIYDADAPKTLDMAERMRRSVRNLGIEHRGSQIWPTVTISVGVAVIRPTPERNLQGALQLADKALYSAKSRGRNRVELLDDAEYRMLVTGVFARDSFQRGAAPGG